MTVVSGLMRVTEVAKPVMKTVKRPGEAPRASHTSRKEQGITTAISGLMA